MEWRPSQGPGGPEGTVNRVRPINGSARNRLPGTVLSVTPVGNRFRVALATPQTLAAEITEAFERLSIRVGDRVDACWKATATRLSPL
jgi:ABC-type molybdate transport system ATPase subunit